ncbi:MAG: hypothetical protein EOO17_04840 [Chloroflexi bacterium]|nr:MAG: hypothetical protein EOO17_04840 [Chloroflexota bacterium]
MSVSRQFLSFLFLVMCSVSLALFLAPDLYAVDFNMSIQDGVNAAKGRDQVTDLFGEAGIFQDITNILLFLVGAISVIMVIIGGLRYVLSGGDSSAVSAAKNTILYAIVGLVVSMLAYAAIAFVIEAFAPGGASSSI